MRYVLGGGWAVWAWAPGTPSVDCDLYLDAAPPGFEAAMAEHGVTVGTRRMVELLSVDGVVEFLGFGDEDLGWPHPGFRPGESILRAPVRRPLNVQGGALETWVPQKPALAMAKLAALRNRDLFWRATSDPAAGMVLGPSMANMIRSVEPNYWLRKAGKDLYDISLLVNDPATASDLRTLMEQNGVLQVLPAVLDELSREVVLVADALAHRAGAPVASEVIHILR